MALTDLSHGTLTADGTEQQLIDDTAGGTYVLEVDAANMAIGDTIELRIYTKALTAGTLGVVYYAVYTNAQGEPLKISVPIASLYECKMTLKQTTHPSSYKTYDWVVYTL